MIQYEKILGVNDAVSKLLQATSLLERGEVEGIQLTAEQKTLVTGRMTEAMKELKLAVAEVER